MFFCCSPAGRFATLFGAKQPWRAHAMAAMPFILQPFEGRIANSMALNWFSHGAFCIIKSVCRGQQVRIIDITHGKPVNCSA